MLITDIKSIDDIRSLIGKKTVVISCEGCKELYFPETAAAEVQKQMQDDGDATLVLVTDYICNPENLHMQLEKHMSIVNDADTILVFSCGVGVQTVAEEFLSKKVFAACDSYNVPGHQGVTALEYDCGQCGECYLNGTGGICPITSCSKSLLNGQCGGTKNGMCEVDKDMECGWERIYRRLEQLGLLDNMLHPAKIRNYTD